MLKNDQKLRVIGLMSGTSLDGCDAVLCEITPNGCSLKIETKGFVTVPMPSELRETIVLQLKPETSRIDKLTKLDSALSFWFIDAVDSLLASTGLKRSDIDLIGSHGQTMWHDVTPGTTHPMTWQLGDGSFIAAVTGDF